ncbi:MAG: trypsin-like peptidase domain-containing protein [Clostridia bacterium]|nr:trypsin-like peptidase domain-containing protein [Clostridia bacterium]
MRMMSKKLMGVMALALVCVMAGTVLGSQLPQAQAETTVVTSPFTEAIAQVRDSVVGINNYQLVNTSGSNYGNGYGNGYGYFPWGYFGFGDFGNGFGGYGYGNGNNGTDSSKEVHAASGSGVVVSEGYVLTNYHVVEDAHSLKISVANDTDEPDLFDATVVAYDADKDVAVLYAPELKLKPVVLGDSDKLVIGDWAILIGNPLGFTGSVTAGIVSALDREIESNDKTSTDKYGRATAVVNKMIQTDAAINSGNSGGGMFNVAGELVGIPTLKYSGSRYSNSAAVENIGMCIPINEAKDVIEEALKADVKDVTANAGKDGQKDDKSAGTDLKGKPRMGVTVTGLVNTNGAVPNGAYVISVEAGSPAEQAGILPGDIIVELNGQVISAVSDMTGLIAQLNEGDKLQVKVFRPETVGDAEKAEISTDGDYVDLECVLAVVDAVAQ